MHATVTGTTDHEYESTGAEAVRGTAVTGLAAPPVASPAPTVNRSVARGMPLPSARGEASAALLEFLSAGRTTSISQVAKAIGVSLRRSENVLRDDDLQLALFCLYELHYGGIAGVSDDWEWCTDLLAIRRQVEKAHEDALRGQVALPASSDGPLVDVLFEMTNQDVGDGFANYLATQATDAQLHEFMVQRSIYTLKQADPHSWGIPRLNGSAKAALVEIQSDEYGGGRPQWMRSSVFARAMRHLDLSAEYGRYVDQATALTLASVNTMTLFGLQRRLRGAIVGHLAAFELVAAAPSRAYGDGFRRNGYGTEVTLYFDEHVEPDSIHTRIAGRDLAESVVAAEPELVDDIVFGAACCMSMEQWIAEETLGAWRSGASALRAVGA